ncbi:MAG TPA: proline iminopeptidase-family hydrolase [Candidatus Bathyarchaeia archaeon]|nr:proline iminopeptidase-family hydrolase [Candidatus Bathyarchaeia archaeon]
MEGFVEILGHKIFYRSFGEPTKGTLLCLHGGPGATHEYLLPMTDLAKHGYRVILYDQLGCGRSEVPKNRALFVMERYVEEVEALRKKLNLQKIHLLGSSCGGQLALGYAVKYQKYLKSLTTIGGLHNVLMTFNEMQRMKRALPIHVYETLKKYEEIGDYDNPEYLSAVMVFYRKHVCRLDKWPKEVSYSLDHISKPVYETMNGPNEFTIIGNIRYWNATPQLHAIKVPTLVTCGRYDEVSPKVAKDIHKHIKSSKLVVFPKSSHLPFWEEREKFIGVLKEFLDQIDS